MYNRFINICYAEWDKVINVFEVKENKYENENHSNLSKRSDFSAYFFILLI